MRPSRGSAGSARARPSRSSSSPDPSRPVRRNLMPTATKLRVASAPVSFGVDEVLSDDAWMPAPDDMLDWMVDIGFEGTELGSPGYMGDAAQVYQRLSSRNLELVGAFLPQHFSRAEKVEEDHAILRDSLRLLAEGSPVGSRPFAV